ncbi:MAG: CRISPR-associated CARF protein Csa3 [Sulfolobaceae archaeon]
MTTVIFNVGFSSEYIIKAITFRGVKNISSVILVTGTSKDEFSKKRNEDAITSILSYLKIVGVEDVKVLRVDLDTTFDDVLLQISAELGKFDDDIEFYLIGGMRVLLLALYYIAQILSIVKKVKVIAFDENMQNSYQLPLTVPKIPKTSSQIELLKLLTKRHKISEMSEKLKKSASTISRQLDSLGELIECRKEGKNKECEASKIGRVILNLIQGSGP